MRSGVCEADSEDRRAPLLLPPLFRSTRGRNASLPRGPSAIRALVVEGAEALFVALSFKLRHVGFYVAVAHLGTAGPD